MKPSEFLEIKNHLILKELQSWSFLFIGGFLIAWIGHLLMYKHLDINVISLLFQSGVIITGIITKIYYAFAMMKLKKMHKHGLGKEAVIEKLNGYL